MARRPSAATETVFDDITRYPLEAFQFLKDGLDFTVQRLHGDPPDAWERLVQFMQRRGIDPDDLREMYERRKLPATIARLIDEMGGIDALESRHVTGPQLCEGLRDLALERWGLLAGSVLRHWNIRSTRDFGEMVFALVRAGMLKQRREDRVEDFDRVYDFAEAFERSYRIRIPVET